MAKHLGKRDVVVVVDIIRGWNECKLTWNLLCDAVEGVIRRRPARQTLHANPEIKCAFQARKVSLREKIPRLPRPGSLAIASHRIERLEREIDELKRKNSLLLAQYVTWQYNAYKKGLTETELCSPLPRIDRERSEPNPMD